MRRLVCLLLLFLMPLHGFAMQVGWSSPIDHYNIGHEIEHLQEKSHHHDLDTGASHYDDSSESATHIADHSTSANVSAIPSSVLLRLISVPLAREAGELSYFIPHPNLERPQRPPLSPG
ncbi:MAG: hypothetical protein V4695_01010 [Pseudomonadota bacterium]